MCVCIINRDVPIIGLPKILAVFVEYQYQYTIGYTTDINYFRQSEFNY